MYFYILLLSATALWIFHRWQQQSRYYILGNKIPGPPALPLVGNALLALFVSSAEDIAMKAMELSNQYGHVFRAWLGPQLFVGLSDADDVEIILNSNVHIDKAPEYRFFEPWLGDGLLISSGEKWRSHRKMIAPTFHINILKSFMPVFNENSKNVVERMKKEMGKTFDVHDYMSETTVDILLETAMGITRTAQVDSGFDYAMAVMEMCNIIQQRQMKFWMRIDATFKLSSMFKKQLKLLDTIHGLTNKVIKVRKNTFLSNKKKGIIPPTLNEIINSNKPVDETRAITAPANESESISDSVFKGYKDDLDFNDEHDVGEKKRLAFLDLLLESKYNGTNKLTDHEIKEEVDTIMFEGHDTTAAGSSFTLCLLGVHQNIQDKVYDELYEIFGDSDRPCTFNDTLSMKYLERVILESLRLFPPVPVIARKLNQDVQIKTNNYILPAGTNVVIGNFKLHRNPKYYKDPEVFNPDNFLPECTSNRHYYSFIPFSAGPRSCVGRKYALLKLKVLISTILRNYKVVSNVTEDQYKIQGDIILKRADGFRLNIEPRMRVPSNAT